MVSVIKQIQKLVHIKEQIQFESALLKITQLKTITQSY